MGTLTSTSDCSGMVVNGIALGDPTFTDEMTEDSAPLFAWDDARFPNGVLDDEGNLTIDEVEV